MLSAACASDFSDRYEKLKKDGNDALIQEFFEKASHSEEKNPDYYAIAGNYWWQLSHTVNISQKPPEAGDFSLHDKKTGKQIGSISTMGQVQPEIPKKAIGILAQGAAKFPWRADIVLGLAYLQKEMGMTKEFVETLKALLSEIKKNPKNLKWTANGSLPEPAESFIPEAIQEYSTTLYQADTPATDALCSQLCSSIIDVFPEHPYAYNILAALATAQGKFDEALRLLQIASSKAPNDPLILLNLGDAYAKTHRKEQAIKSYKRVLEIKAEPSLKTQAEESIKKIEKDRGASGPSHATPKNH